MSDVEDFIDPLDQLQEDQESLSFQPSINIPTEEKFEPSEDIESSSTNILDEMDNLEDTFEPEEQSSEDSFSTVISSEYTPSQSTISSTSTINSSLQSTSLSSEKYFEEQFENEQQME